MDIGGKLLVSKKIKVVNKDSIGIDKDLTKDQNLNTFKMYCKRRKSSARFPDKKARNRLYACHCIAGNVQKAQTLPVVRQIVVHDASAAKIQKEKRERHYEKHRAKGKSLEIINGQGRLLHKLCYLQSVNQSPNRNTGKNYKS